MVIVVFSILPSQSEQVRWAVMYRFSSLFTCYVVGSLLLALGRPASVPTVSRNINYCDQEHRHADNLIVDDQKRHRHDYDCAYCGHPIPEEWIQEQILVTCHPA